MKAYLNHNMTTEQVIDLLFDSTQPDGTLVVCSPMDEDRTPLHCKMAWNAEDREQVKAECDALIDAIAAIAELDEGAEIEGEELNWVWETYLRPFDAEEEADREMLSDIALRLDLEEPVEPEELAVYDAYVEQVSRECEQRVGNRPFAFREVIRAKRVYTLMALGAPWQPIVIMEAQGLAIAMVLHRFAVEQVPDKVVPIIDY